MNSKAWQVFDGKVRVLKQHLHFSRSKLHEQAIVNLSRIFNDYVACNR